MAQQKEKLDLEYAENMKYFNRLRNAVRTLSDRDKGLNDV